MKSLFVLSCSFCLFSAAEALNVGNLQKCTDDIVKALATPTEEPVHFIPNYAELMQALQTPEVRASLPKVYQDNFLNPFITYLQGLGESRFNLLFSQQPHDDTSAFLQQIIPDIAEAILQNGTDFEAKATNAFEEVISDLYDGFLSEESRNSTGQKIKPPDRGVIAPLVKWGNPDAGPYTWPVDATLGLNVRAAVVSLPPAHLKAGLLAWSALGHETAGHDILHADTGLLQELGSKVYNAIISNLGGNSFLASYWRNCIDESASDVMGLLNMGPTVGLGLVGYFRGLTGGKLRNQGPFQGPHPLDILRGCLAARVVSQLSFAGAAEWAQAIQAEVNKDIETIYLIDMQTGYRYRVPTQQAMQSAQIAADVIMNTKLTALEGHSLKEIQDWSDADQKIAAEIGVLLHKTTDLPVLYKSNGYYAAHVVAGALQEALEKGANVQTIFNRMVKFLDIMHQYNDTWRKTPNKEFSPVELETVECTECHEA